MDTLIAIFWNYNDVTDKYWIRQQRNESIEQFIQRAKGFARQQYHVEYAHLDVNIG